MTLRIQRYRVLRVDPAVPHDLEAAQAMKYACGRMSRPCGQNLAERWADAFRRVYPRAVFVVTYDDPGGEWTSLYRTYPYVGEPYPEPDMVDEWVPLGYTSQHEGSLWVVRYGDQVIGARSGQLDAREIARVHARVHAAVDEQVLEAA
ncbi:hypothetical protein [Longimicrobium sp.]|jgi:hypothetical protein|uniref:hypothetical protein n=1 Tax=Longimicrobium sp. TaxID=2029185 RepID=UPI002F92C98E